MDDKTSIVSLLLLLLLSIEQCTTDYLHLHRLALQDLCTRQDMWDTKAAK
jgi:hypothetical protein